MYLTSPRDDCGDNPFNSYDAIRDWLDDTAVPDDDIMADDWGVDADYIYDNLTGK